MVIKLRSILKPIIVAVPLLVVSPAANAFIEVIAYAVVGVVYLLAGVAATTTGVAENSSEHKEEDARFGKIQFVKLNSDNLASDMAQGGGEYLATLAYMEGCPTEVHEKFSQMTQNNFHRIYERPDPDPEDILDIVGKEIRKDPLLSYKCTGTTLEKPVDMKGIEDDVVDDPIFSSENPLSEEQLLSKIIGNTLMGRNNNVGKWAEYYELSKVGESYGKIYGKTKRLYSGSWKIDGSVMCFNYQGSDSGGCWMLALDGNIVTWYKPNGEKDESDFPTMLIPDNPNNF